MCGTHFRWMCFALTTVVRVCTNTGGLFTSPGCVMWENWVGVATMAEPVKHSQAFNHKSRKLTCRDRMRWLKAMTEVNGRMIVNYHRPYPSCMVIEEGSQYSAGLLRTQHERYPKGNNTLHPMGLSIAIHKPSLHTHIRSKRELSTTVFAEANLSEPRVTSQNNTNFQTISNREKKLTWGERLEISTEI